MKDKPTLGQMINRKGISSLSWFYLGLIIFFTNCANDPALPNWEETLAEQVENLGFDNTIDHSDWKFLESELNILRNTISKEEYGELDSGNVTQWIKLNYPQIQIHNRSRPSSVNIYLDVSGSCKGFYQSGSMLAFVAFLYDQYGQETQLNWYACGEKVESRPLAVENNMDFNYLQGDIEGKNTPIQLHLEHLAENVREGSLSFYLTDGDLSNGGGKTFNSLQQVQLKRLFEDRVVKTRGTALYRVPMPFKGMWYHPQTSDGSKTTFLENAPRPLYLLAIGAEGELIHLKRMMENWRPAESEVHRVLLPRRTTQKHCTTLRPTSTVAIDKKSNWHPSSWGNLQEIPEFWQKSKLSIKKLGARTEMHLLVNLNNDRLQMMGELAIKPESYRLKNVDPKSTNLWYVKEIEEVKGQPSNECGGYFSHRIKISCDSVGRPYSDLLVELTIPDQKHWMEEFQAQDEEPFTGTPQLTIGLLDWFSPIYDAYQNSMNPNYLFSTEIKMSEAR